jgi:acyl-CoA synthetase (AMP-forming)/AMP-acid ligase II
MAVDWLEGALRLAAIAPTKTAFTFLNDDGTPEASITYQQLELQTRSLARALLAEGPNALKPGDRALLVYLPSLDFIIAFIACLRAGIVAVPTYPPDPVKSNANFGAFASIARDCGARVALTHKAYNQLVSLAALKDAASRFFSAFSKGGAGSGVLQWPDLVWVPTDGVVLASRSDEVPLALAVCSSLEQLAFLQYTSGSTAEPKGVMITSGNLQHNLSTITRSLVAGPDTVVVSWLPCYHDMGLIGGSVFSVQPRLPTVVLYDRSSSLFAADPSHFLLALAGSYLGVLFCGGSGVYMSPLSFIKRPSLWPEAMSKYRATHVQTPNFGLKLTSRKWADALSRSGPSSQPLDLSCVRHIFNAAEPVTLSAMCDFIRTFAPYGLREQALSPGYGLAEHTVYVCDGGDLVLRIDSAAYETTGAVVVKSERRLVEAVKSPGDDVPTGETEVVSCGPVAPHATALAALKNKDILVFIVDGATRELLGDRKVGEIWVSSPSKAAGYWAKEELTSTAFQAKIIAAASGADGETAAVAAASRTESPIPRDSTFLRTGDLGFVHAGQLFVSGRSKDLVIVRGRNYYPQDFESTIEASLVDSVRPGCVAVFQAPGLRRGAVNSSVGEDCVVAAVEVRDPGAPVAELTRLASSIRSVIMLHYAVALDAIVLLRPHAARKVRSNLFR